MPPSISPASTVTDPHAALEKLGVLRSLLARTGGCAVAFSGGVDSTFLLAVVREVLDTKCMAVVATGAMYPRGETTEAESLARDMGVRCEFVESPAMEHESFLENPPDK